MHPRLEIIQRITRLDSHFPDDERFPGVDFGNDLVHHDARPGDPALLESVVRSTDSIGPVKLARERRVEVDDRDRKVRRTLRDGGRVRHVRLQLRGGRRGSLDAFEDGEKGGAEDVHPSGEDNQIRFGLDDATGDFLVIVFPGRAGDLVEKGLERADL